MTGNSTSPTVGKLYAFMDAMGVTIYDILDAPRPSMNSDILQEFIREALEYQGALSPDELASVVARAYLRHPGTGMTSQELARLLDLLEPANGTAGSR